MSEINNKQEKTTATRSFSRLKTASIFVLVAVIILGAFYANGVFEEGEGTSGVFEEGEGMETGSSENETVLVPETEDDSSDNESVAVTEHEEITSGTILFGEWRGEPIQ